MWESKTERQLKKLIEVVEDTNKIIIKFLLPRMAKGGLNMLKVAAGQVGVVFTFQELDQNGKPIAPLGPINVVSDNLAVATVDNTKQVTDPVTFITKVPVVAVAGNTDGSDGKANITASDPATINQVSLTDTLTVQAVNTTPVATTAVGGLALDDSVINPPVAAGPTLVPANTLVLESLAPSSKNPLALD